MILNEQRQREWKVRLADFETSGLKMTHWCSVNHVNLGQMKYWMRKFKKSSTPVPFSTSKSFIPLTAIEPISPIAPAKLVIRVGPANIELQPGFDPQLLREAIEALSGSC